MEEHPLWVTEKLNELFGPLVVWVFEALGLPLEHPEHPIPNHIAMELVVAVFFVLFFSWLRTRLSVDRPGGTQQLFERIYLFVRQQIDDVIGHHGRPFLPFVGTIGVFILFCNLLGLVPGFLPPTMNPTVTTACALLVFFHYNYQGFRAHGGAGYAKHFVGPILELHPIMVLLLAPLFFLIEIVSHLARPFSLAVRLFANMFAGENVTVVLLNVMYVIFPAAFMGLHLLVGSIQAFIFTILPISYLAGAVAHEH